MLLAFLVLAVGELTNLTTKNPGMETEKKTPSLEAKKLSTTKKTAENMPPRKHG